MGLSDAQWCMLFRGQDYRDHLPSPNVSGVQGHYKAKAIPDWVHQPLISQHEDTPDRLMVWVITCLRVLRSDSELLLDLIVVCLKLKG